MGAEFACGREAHIFPRKNHLVPPKEGDEKPEFLTTTERRGRHKIEQSQIGPKGEGVGTSESKKRRTRSQKRDLARRRSGAERKKNRKFEGGKRKDFLPANERDGRE